MRRSRFSQLPPASQGAAQSLEVAPALMLRVAWLGELKAPGPDRAVGPVRRDDDAGRVGLRFEEFQFHGSRAFSEQAFAAAQHHGKRQHREFVDETVLPQRLKQSARTLYKKVGTVAPLKGLQRFDRIF